MDSTPFLSYDGMKLKSIPFVYYLNILGIPFIIGILYAELVMEENCSYFNDWLWVELIAQIVITAASISEISKKFISKSGWLVKFPLLILTLFQFAWLILGLVWVFTESVCMDVFPEGYIMIAIISFVVYATVLVYSVLYLITFIVEMRKKNIN